MEAYTWIYKVQLMLPSDNKSWTPWLLFQFYLVCMYFIIYLFITLVVALFIYSLLNSRIFILLLLFNLREILPLNREVIFDKLLASQFSTCTVPHYLEIQDLLHLGKFFTHLYEILAGTVENKFLQLVASTYFKLNLLMIW